MGIAGANVPGGMGLRGAVRPRLPRLVRLFAAILTKRHRAIYNEIYGLTAMRVVRRPSAGPEMHKLLHQFGLGGCVRDSKASFSNDAMLGLRWAGLGIRQGKDCQHHKR